jgi:hypothetical protein
MHFTSKDYSLSRLKNNTVPTQNLVINLPNNDIIEKMEFDSYDFVDEPSGKFLKKYKL